MLYKERQVKEPIKDLLESCGFQIKTMFTFGRLRACLSDFWYCFITYTARVTPFSHTPSFMQHKGNHEYNFARYNGYTVFAKASKNTRALLSSSR